MEFFPNKRRSFKVCFLGEEVVKFFQIFMKFHDVGVISVVVSIEGNLFKMLVVPLVDTILFVG